MGIRVAAHVVAAGLTAAACGDFEEPRLFRGRVDAASFLGGPPVSGVTVTGRDGIVARADMSSDGALFFAVPHGEHYRVELDTTGTVAYSLVEDGAAELSVTCPGPVHDLGSITALVHNCCDDALADRDRCVVGCAVGGTEFDECFGHCAEEVERYEHCLPTRSRPECERIDGAFAEHPFIDAGIGCEAP